LTGKLEPLLSVDDAAAILQMSAGWIKSEIKAGRLKQTKLGKIVRIEQCDLRSFIDDCKEKTPVPEIVTTLSLPGDFDTEGAILKVTETRKG